jgi:hypothetical protein
MTADVRTQRKLRIVDFEVALLAKGIDLAGGNPDLNDLPIERRSASEVCHALSRARDGVTFRARDGVTSDHSAISKRSNSWVLRS